MARTRKYLRRNSTRIEIPYRFVRGIPQRQRSAAAPISALPLVDPSVLSIFQFQMGKNNRKIASPPLPVTAFPDLSWYLVWLAQKVDMLPGSLVDLIAGENTISSVDLSLDSNLYRIFMAVNEYIRQSRSASIDEIIEHLCEESVLESANERHPAQRLLIFVILGWQSMVYLPSFNSCTLHELAIHQDIDQPNSNLVFDNFKLPADLADRPMAILLKGYGNLLPARPQELSEIAGETSAPSWLPLMPSETNAYLLHTLLQIEIRWVDTLSLHLDYDGSTRTLSLFRYPSFCTTMLHSQGALFSFASTDLSRLDPRASCEDIKSILLEILISYRLLFGLSKASRKLFRHLLKSDPALSHNADPLLRLICAKELFAHPLVPRDRLIYFLHRDFPVLGTRIGLLLTELKGAKPKGWMALLKDRRDTMQYWTFWLVAIVGGASILLSLMQVILQIFQIAKS